VRRFVASAQVAHVGGALALAHHSSACLPLSA
jgi:hypothetical protein